MRFPVHNFPVNYSRLPGLPYMPYGPVVGGIGAVAVAAWPTANKALFFPFRLAEPLNVTGLGVVNGTTINGNWDAGIYNEDGVRLASSGSVAQTGSAATQVYTFTSAVRLAPGICYLAALASSTSTGNINRLVPTTQVQRAIGCFEQASAFPLPAPATFATNTVNYFPSMFLVWTNRSTVNPLRPYGLPALTTIHTYSYECIGHAIVNRLGLHAYQVANTAWAGANWAFATPFTLNHRQTFQRIWCYNGATVNGNIDMGIYDFELKKIASTGSTAMSGASVLQPLTLSVTIGPGRFYMALGCSSASATFMRATVGDPIAFFAAETMWASSHFPLPDTFAINQFPNYAPLIGISKGTVI